MEKEDANGITQTNRTTTLMMEPESKKTAYCNISSYSVNFSEGFTSRLIRVNVSNHNVYHPLNASVVQTYGQMGGKLQFRCKVQPAIAPVASLYWMKGNPNNVVFKYFVHNQNETGACGEFRNRSVHGIFNYFGGFHEVTIPRSHIDDETVFFCKVYTYWNDSSSANGRIRLILPASDPKLYQFINETIVPAGPHINTTDLDVRLLCQATSRPSSNISWSYGHITEMVNNTDDIGVVEQNSTIKLPTLEGLDDIVICFISSPSPNFTETHRNFNISTTVRNIRAGFDTNYTIGHEGEGVNLFAEHGYPSKHVLAISWHKPPYNRSAFATLLVESGRQLIDRNWQDRAYFTEPLGTLHLRNATVEDIGSYMCRIEAFMPLHRYKITVLRVQTLKMYGVSEFHVSMIQTYGHRGNTSNMRCVHPLPASSIYIVSWYKQTLRNTVYRYMAHGRSGSLGEFIGRNVKGRNEINFHSLTIPVSVPLDETDYFCEIIPITAQTSASRGNLRLRVPLFGSKIYRKENGTFRPALSREYTESTGRITLLCQVKSKPASNISLHDPGEIFKFSASTTITHGITEKNYTVTIEVPKKNTKTAMFFIVSPSANFTRGYEEHRMAIKVSNPFDYITLLLSVHQLYGLLHGKTIIQCRYTPKSGHVLILSWYKGGPREVYRYMRNNTRETGPRGEFINRGVTGEFNRAKAYHQLKIPKSIRSDAASYTCEITPRGKRVNATKTIQLRVPLTSATIYRKVNDTFVRANDHEATDSSGMVTLLCRAVSLPKSKVEWDAGIRKTSRSCVFANGTVEANQTTLVMVEPQGTRTVTCSITSPNPDFSKSNITTSLSIQLKNEFRYEPLNITITQTYGHLHGKATIKCVYTPVTRLILSVLWLKRKAPVFYYSQNNQNKTGPRGEFIGRNVTGNMNLIRGYHQLDIYDTGVDDEAVYTCSIVPYVSNEADTWVAFANLTLIVPPHTVHVYRRENGIIREAKMVEETERSGYIWLMCSTISRPGAVINWSDGNMEDYQDNIINGTVHRNRTVKTWIYPKKTSIVICNISAANPDFMRSNLTRQLSIKALNKHGIYSEFHQSEGRLRGIAIMRVSYLPRLDPQNIRIISWDGQGVTVYKHYQNAPSRTGPRNFWKNRNITGEIGRGYHEIQIPVSTLRDATKYTCDIIPKDSNLEITFAEGTLDLRVALIKAAVYQMVNDTSVRVNSSVSTDQQGRITLLCQALARPHCNLTWSHGQQDNSSYSQDSKGIYATNRTMSLVVPSQQIVYCTIRSPSLNFSVSHEMSLIKVKVANPHGTADSAFLRVTIVEKEAKLGAAITLRCYFAPSIEGVRLVKWYRGRGVLSILQYDVITSSHQSIFSKPDNFVGVFNIADKYHDLKISRLKQDDVGEYTCITTTATGKTSTGSYHVKV